MAFSKTHDSARKQGGILGQGAGRVLLGSAYHQSASSDSLSSLWRTAKSLTILLAGYLAEFVAEILRVVITHPYEQLVDEENIHLLGANYWIRPIYQELLHASSRHNATAQGERKLPCSGLAKVIAHAKQEIERLQRRGLPLQFHPEKKLLIRSSWLLAGMGNWLGLLTDRRRKVIFTKAIVL